MLLCVVMCISKCVDVLTAVSSNLRACNINQSGAGLLRPAQAERSRNSALRLLASVCKTACSFKRSRPFSW